MHKANRIRRTAALTLLVATVLFTAGAGQAVALERAQDTDVGPNIVITFLERIGDFVGGIAGEVVEIFTKATPSPGSDG